MHRYSAASCGSGVGNSSIGGSAARETARSDVSLSSSPISLTSRRPVQLTPYKLKCDREFLNSRLGPPDFYPPTPNCPEETLTREAVQHGYKEAIDGIEETKETVYSLVNYQYWSKSQINQYKESIRKRLRAINDARVQKRKAGQVYGVPLSGPLLTKSGVFPEQRPYGEDFRKKWIEGLSQQHKRLRSLAEHVPHGYRRKSLFEPLIKHNVPLLRATWFIKVTYLNQVRPLSVGMSGGGADKTQEKRAELWTKDVIEYLQYLLDEACQNDVPVSTLHSKDQSPQMLSSCSGQHQGADCSQTSTDGEEPSLHFKWCYMVRILYWHYAEGLLHRPQVIDWVLMQLQEKDSLGALELLLPIVFELIDSIALSQTHIRKFVDRAVYWLRELCPSGSMPDSKDHPREGYNAVFLTELLRYLVVVVPDTFVALDCFPLPSCVCPSDLKRDEFSSIAAMRDAEKVSLDRGMSKSINTSLDIERQASERELPIADLASSIQKRAANLAKAVNPGLLHNNEGKVVQALDKAVILGDIKNAYHCVFEDCFFSENMAEEMLSEISPCVRSSLTFIGTLLASEVYSVFFLYEWATCDFRDCRGSLPVDRKVTGGKDFARVYMAVSLMKLKMEELQRKPMSNNKGGANGDVASGVLNTAIQDGFTSMKARGKVDMLRNKSENFGTEYLKKNLAHSDVFLSPGPLHDTVVAWLDQHESRKGEGFNRLQVLLRELIRFHLFHPHAYVRQLIISGIMDKRATAADIERANRHKHILQHLPGPPLFDALEGMKAEADATHSELIRIYSNERHFILHGFLDRRVRHLSNGGENLLGPKRNQFKDNLMSGLDGNVSITLEQKRNSEATNSVKLGGDKSEKRKLQVAELKYAISAILHLPDLFLASNGKPSVIRSSVVQGKLKRPLGPQGVKPDKVEGTPGCEECGRSKKQKITEEKSLLLKGFAFNPVDDEETWWARKGPKLSDVVKVEQPSKPTKQSARGRAKTVRKTQSLAQLAAARIEGSQGASSSHICDSKITCPYHRPNLEGETASQTKDGNKLSHTSDLHAIGKAIKNLRLAEKWSIASWLDTVVRQLIEGRERPSVKSSLCAGQGASLGTFSTACDDRTAVRWQLGEDELSVILYVLDMSMDMQSIVKLLLWLLPKVSIPASNTPGHGGRSMPILAWNKEGAACEVGEALILSCLQRYENILTATDLLPEALSVCMRRIAAVMGAVPGARASCPTILYARNLLKKYGGLESVVIWEKNFKASCDQRLIAELEALKSGEGESTFALVGGSGTSISEDCDDHLRQKLSGRLSRIGPNIKETVQKRIEDAIQHIFTNERELLFATCSKNSGTDRWDDGYQRAQHTVLGLIDCIRQNGCGTPQGDSSVVATAVAAVVGNVGPATVSMLNLAASSPYPVSSSVLRMFSIKCARRVVQIHIHCLRLLKEALGERQNRVLEMTLATEASSAINGAFGPGRAPRSQYQLSPETPDPSSTLANEMLSSSTKGFLGKATKVAAAVAALVTGAVVYGITSLERMVAVLKIREGLEIPQLLKNGRSSSNGLPRAMGVGNTIRADSSIEVYLYWFRVLISNCRTVSDGLVADLLGESNVLALARMQRMMPLNSIFPPTYSIFAMVVWMNNLPYMNMPNREDTVLHQSLSSAIVEAIRHGPIRDVCLRDPHAFYHHLTCDTSDSEFAAMLDIQGLDMHSKKMALVPLRGRLFLHALLDCQMPPSILLQDEGNWIHSHGDAMGSATSEPRLVDQLVYILDTLQPARFHWQWLELRLLLNEQVLIEKIESQNISVVEAMQTLTPVVDNSQLSESEKTFTEIVLTRLLLRPDAAPLYSEAVHLLGKSLEEYLLLHVKWVLEGNDVLLGRKSLRQLLAGLDTMAHCRGFCVKPLNMKAWGWSLQPRDASVTESDKKRTEVASPEEGEVAEEGFDWKRDGKQSNASVHVSDARGSNVIQHFAVEKALADLVLPCLARSSNDTCSTFAIELIKQMNILEQHINSLTRNAGKSTVLITAGAEGAGTKGHGARKGIRGGSPGLGRRVAGATESSPPLAAALQVSMWLRLQFLLPLLPIIHADREPSARNMRQTLAPVLLRLLGTRVVQDAVDPFSIHLQKHLTPKKEFEWYAEASAASAAAVAGESLFDRFLSVLHALLSSAWPGWLRPRSTCKVTKSVREVPAFEREVAERMQAELDHMQLSPAVRIRLQAAMPLVPPPPISTISSVPPYVSASAVPILQISALNTSSFPPGTVGLSQKGSVRIGSAIGKCKSTLYQDPEMEIDPWTLLEDGTGSGMVGSNIGGGVSGDHANLKACNWLKGAVRVRRTDLTYVGAVDDDT